MQICAYLWEELSVSKEVQSILLSYTYNIKCQKFILLKCEPVQK